MTYAFISYSKKDASYARVLTEHLLDTGFDVWIDEQIEYGDNWERAIFKAIDHCGAFIVIMSPNSYESAWVPRECHYAERHDKPTFPLLLAGEEFPRYTLTQYVDVRGGVPPLPDFARRLERCIPKRETRGQRHGYTGQASESSQVRIQQSIPITAVRIDSLQENKSSPYQLRIRSRVRAAGSQQWVDEDYYFPLRNSQITAGRVAGNDLVLKPLQVSRQHFKLIRVEGGYVVVDNGSANGTFVQRSDNHIAVYEPLLLVHGDIIDIAGCSVEYLAPEAEAAQKLLVALGRAFDPEIAAPIGRELAHYCDPRPGVGLELSTKPNIDWVSVPAGGFTYQRNEVVGINSFAISRYPITNSQFDAFVQTGAYELPQYWDAAGIVWKNEQNRPKSVQENEFGLGNHPVTNVSYFEAQAFCRWLSHELRLPVRLPTEQEWEKAASGVDGSLYPWGDHFISGNANIDETRDTSGIHNQARTTAVGIYSRGVSPYGLYDMCGNVWEWCSSEADAPVLRGGSWISSADGATNSSRRVVAPDESETYIGFRVVYE